MEESLAAAGFQEKFPSQPIAVVARRGRRSEKSCRCRSSPESGWHSPEVSKEGGRGFNSSVRQQRTSWGCCCLIAHAEEGCSRELAGEKVKCRRWSLDPVLRRLGFPLGCSRARRRERREKGLNPDSMRSVLGMCTSPPPTIRNVTETTPPNSFSQTR